MPVDDEMRDVLLRAIGRLADAGAHVDTSLRPKVDVAAAWRMGARVIGAAVALSDEVDHGLTHREWLVLHRDRVVLRAAWAEVFEHVDIVCCPVTALPAFEHLQAGRWNERVISVNGATRPYVELEAWPAVVGAAYLPSTSTPVGSTPGGLPVGMQVVAPYLHDRRSIAVSQLVAELCADPANPTRIPPILPN
jgi:amidase